jgi:CheY-like chemotaxis protein/two-component sensor histidine kinase
LSWSTPAHDYGGSRFALWGPAPWRSVHGVRSGRPSRGSVSELETGTPRPALLDVARVQSGHIELQREAVDLGKLVEHCAETLGPAEHVRARELTLSTPSLLVDADPARLEQIVTNLLANALKYTAPGGQISVSVRREHNRALLCVKDDGIGIAPDLLPRVFDLFVQADRSLDRSKGGLGLGLTLVKRLADLHGGTVSAHSEGPDRGSEFIVDLPLARPGDSRTAGPDPSVAPLACRVLIVEDHPDAREGLRLLLNTMGHTVRVAANGDEGLRTLRSWRPDVAIVDIGLPGLDGYALARAVRTERELNGVLLVALTGYGRSEDRQQAIDAGFEMHLVKPVSLEVLSRVFDRTGARAKPHGIAGKDPGGSESFEEIRGETD